tara:strand:+ start:482 stop:871 length:390 start_codon:yes stop_codon:yes gene_type:complete
MHWIYKRKPFTPNLERFGFVYKITNKKTKKAYIGCKQYFIGSKTKKPSGWESYAGSSKHLLVDIDKIGKKHFTFQIIGEYDNKRSLKYYECFYQMKLKVLTAVLEGTDEPAYYNNYVGGKFYRPIRSED